MSNEEWWLTTNDGFDMFFCLSEIPAFREQFDGIDEPYYLKRKQAISRYWDLIQLSWRQEPKPSKQEQDAFLKGLASQRDEVIKEISAELAGELRTHIPFAQAIEWIDLYDLYAERWRQMFMAAFGRK